VADDQTSLSPLAETIRHYLERYPASSDTALGVARWWLQGLPLSHGLEEVREALDELAAAGLVDKNKNPDGENRYSASQRLQRN